MEKIVKFEDYKSKCLGCAGLEDLGAGDCMCSLQHYEDGTDIFPVLQGKKTDDFYACNGDGFVPLNWSVLIRQKKQTLDDFVDKPPKYYEAGRKPLPKIINTANSK